MLTSATSTTHSTTPPLPQPPTFKPVAQPPPSSLLPLPLPLPLPHRGWLFAFGTPEAGRLLLLPAALLCDLRCEGAVCPLPACPPARLNIPPHTLAHLRLLSFAYRPDHQPSLEVQLLIGLSSLIRIVSFGQESVHHRCSTSALACRSRACRPWVNPYALSLLACCRHLITADCRPQTAAKDVQQQVVSWRCRSCVAAQPQAPSGTSGRRPFLSTTITRSLISAPLAAPSAPIIITLGPVARLLDRSKSLTSPTDLSALG